MFTKRSFVFQRYPSTPAQNRHTLPKCYRCVLHLSPQSLKQWIVGHWLRSCNLPLATVLCPWRRVNETIQFGKSHLIFLKSAPLLWPNGDLQHCLASNGYWWGELKGCRGSTSENWRTAINLRCKAHSANTDLTVSATSATTWTRNITSFTWSCELLAGSEGPPAKKTGNISL